MFFVLIFSYPRLMFVARYLSCLYKLNRNNLPEWETPDEVKLPWEKLAKAKTYILTNFSDHQRLSFYWTQVFMDIKLIDFEQKVPWRLDTCYGQRHSSG